MKTMQIDQNNSASGLPATKHRQPGARSLVDMAQAQREHEIRGAKLGVFAEIAALRRAIRQHVAQERRASIRPDTSGSTAWSGQRARSAAPGATWNTKILVL